MCYQPKDSSSMYFSKYFGHLMWRADSWKKPWFLKRLRTGEQRGDRGWDGSVQFSSVTQSCPTLCDHMDCSMPGLPIHHQLLEFRQTHVHWVSDAIQPSHPLRFPSPHTFNLSQHQGLSKWVGYLHQIGKALEFQLKHQSFQCIFRTDLL